MEPAKFTYHKEGNEAKNNPESYEVAMAIYNNEIGIDKKYPGKG